MARTPSRARPPGSGYGAASAACTARSIRARVASSTSAISASATPSSASRARAIVSGSRASQRSTSSGGRYFAGSAFEWPWWR